jgi:1-acyl-sn-glycerol-3-phosphate acyltransferase
MYIWLIVVYYLTVMVFSSAVFFCITLPLWLITFPFDRRLRLLHLATCAWASLYSINVPSVKLIVEDREKIRKDREYVIISNHQSLLDIVVIFRLFSHFKWVSKSSIFWIPFIGWNMLLNRYVMLKRGRKKSIELMIMTCEKRIDEGSSVFFFPEGTRSEDGNVKQFKLGAFEVAKRKQIPILPIVIAGTGQLLPKNTLKYGGPRNAYMRVLDEIPYSAFENLSVKETADMARDIIINNLVKLKKEMNA